MSKQRFWALAGLGAGAAAVAIFVGAGQLYGSTKTSDSATQPLPAKVDYNVDVRPILVENCFSCHGHDPEMRKAGLRLDIADAAYGKLPQDPTKHAVVRGNPNKSELLRRILASDPDTRMPPVSSHKVLTPYQIAVLTKWIKQGAAYEQHWAYIPPKEVAPTPTPWDKQAVNPIDKYVYDNILKAGLKPSPEADRETLINRVSMDLTGLPPTLKEVDAFVADKSPNAYEKVVDRLLASPAYAERMTGTWMDAARYSDTDGFLNDPDGRFQFPYRDWVITAFMRDIPYDQFVTWQIAGDKLPHPTREQILATAFTRMNAKSNENGLIDEEYRVAYVDERTEMVGKVFLGLTVGCAKCHDHKYDTISQADYYSLGGFFNSVDERGMAAGEYGPTLDWPTPMQAQRLTKAKAVTAQKQAAYDAALAAARHDAEAKAGALSRQPLGGLLQASLDASQQAYYPFENYYKASFEPLMIEPKEAAAGGRYAALRALVPGGGNLVRDKSGVMKFGGAGKPGADAKAGPHRPGLLKTDLPLDGKHAGPPGAMGKHTGPLGAHKPGLLKTGMPLGGKPGDKSGAPAAMASAAPAAPPKDPGRPRIAQDELNLAVGEHLAAGLPLEVPDGSIRKKQLFVGLKEPELFWTTSGAPGGKPGAMNNGHIVQGPPGHGKAVLVDDTIGFADKDVGKFERTQPFTLDLWIKLPAGKVYDKVNILFNGSAYAIGLEKNHLVWSIVHSAPYDEIEIESLQPVPTGRWQHVTATYDGSSRAGGLKLYGDGQPMPSQMTHDNLSLSTVPRGGHTQFGSYTGLSIGHVFGVPEFKDGAVDELRVFTKALNPLEVAYLNDAGSLKAFKAGQVKADLVDYLADQDPRVVAADAALKQAVLAQQAAEQPIKKIDVLKDQPLVRPTYLLTRGNYDQPGQQVPVQALPQVFPWTAKYPRNRLGLAEWLFDAKNPLTARVYVNRLWAGHFGAGIVETVEDFGAQGSSPSNLPLLDYLAVEFRRSGWDIKHMQKLMVMSATYRQASDIAPGMAERDPRNILLTRGPRYRLPAESIRDNALFASGLLVSKLGGDAVFPYQPDGVWKSMGTGPNIYPTVVPNDEMHRRSLYTYEKRNAQFPSMVVFDQPDRNTSNVARKISNTPLQALVLLNDPQFIEAYRKLAERAIKLAPGDEAQQDVMMFRLATRRHPTAKEEAVMRQYRAGEMQRLGADPDSVKKILAIGVAPADPKLDPLQLAAMTMTTAVVMNSPDAYSLR